MTTYPLLETYLKGQGFAHSTSAWQRGPTWHKSFANGSAYVVLTDTISFGSSIKGYPETTFDNESEAIGFLRGFLSGRITTIGDLVGKTISEIQQIEDTDLQFTLTTGEKFILTHDQDCCEDVRIEDVTGDLECLVGYPLTMAEEAVSQEDPPDASPDMIRDESYTWTFYKFATIKGYVTIRWFGSSNGYYSESVAFKQIQ